MGPRDRLDAVTRKIRTPCRESNPARPARSLVALLTGLSRFLNMCGSERSVQPFLRDLVTLLMFNEGYKLCRFSLASFLRPIFSSSVS
jgi:hypothetical protein